MFKSKTKKQIALFLVLTFVLSWAFMFVAAIPAMRQVTPESSKEVQAIAVSLLALVMFFPTIGVLLTRLITRDWTDCKLMPHFKGNAAPYLIGWFGPLVLTLIGAALFFAFYPQLFTTATFMEKPWGVLLVLVAPLMNLVNCFGEEWGWRGFLFPKMREGRSFVSTSILVGLIWGLWHAPIIAYGHNYGKVWGTDPWGDVVLAIVGMCVFCVVATFLFGYISEKADSVWPAVLAHGCVNGGAGIGLLFLASPDVANPFIGPAPVGIIGGIPFILVALWSVAAMRKREKAG